MWWPKGTHLSETIARDSKRGEKEARKFNPRALAQTKRKARNLRHLNAVESSQAQAIDKRTNRKREKLAKREAKRRGLTI